MKDKIAGKAEELKGRLTGDRATEMKGKARQKLGGAKQTGKEIVYDAEHPRRRRIDGDVEDDVDDRPFAPPRP